MAFRRLLEEKGSYEEQMWQKIDHSYQSAHSVKTSIQDLRQQITEQSQQNASVQSQINELQRLNQLLDQEAYNLEQEMKARKESSYALKQEHEEFIFEISNFKEERSKVKSAIWEQE
eukprot:CAMPEP_0170543322 /NCGR_PEP_ID=MMETSP0211-20121228/2473_1 /TAXON_ID=311385 /ORGANISM="Pseudokeronopsis sp., Strain OXSARD2" /LENGTH=116 /DNA_ID=CAMNT_0010846659 /DNA_START=157 /DNA_END=507 /DNA_ORIENTATION=+